MKDITVGTMVNINVHSIVLFYLHTAVKKNKLLMPQRRYNKKKYNTNRMGSHTCTRLLIKQISYNLSHPMQVLSPTTPLQQFIIFQFKPHPSINLNGMLFHRKSCD